MRRESDAGPSGAIRCHACDSKDWRTLSDCAECGKHICSECEDAVEVGIATLVCGDCRGKVMDLLADSMEISDGPLCDEIDAAITEGLREIMGQTYWPDRRKEIN